MKPNLTPSNAASLTALALLLAVGLAAAPASAQTFTMNVEPAVSFWADQPQINHFTPGGYLALRPGVSLGRVVTLQWSYSLLLTPADTDFTEYGSAHFLTAGLRLRPFGRLIDDEDRLHGLFVDGNVGYVRTGELDRFAFDAGLGFNFQATPRFALGPVVRYGQILQSDNVPNVDPNDAQYLTVGLNLAFGAAPKDEPPPPAPIAVVAEPLPVTPAPVVAPVAVVEPERCKDGDSDGVCDVDDRCLNQAGSAELFGCPGTPCIGPTLLVVVQFDQDSKVLPIHRENGPQTMDPVLDAVATAIGKDPSCRVCIIGYSSEEGATEHNDDLSLLRASAVQGYMTARGVSASQIPITGLGESCQLDPWESRPMNRRVQFQRLLAGESCPTECLK